MAGNLSHWHSFIEMEEEQALENVCVLKWYKEQFLSKVDELTGFIEKNKQLLQEKQNEYDFHSKELKKCTKCIYAFLLSVKRISGERTGL